MYKERYKTAKFIDFVNFNPLSAKGSIWIPQVQPTVVLSPLNFCTTFFHIIFPWEMQFVLSHPIPWDISHGIPIPMDKPVDITFMQANSQQTLMFSLSDVEWYPFVVFVRVHVTLGSPLQNAGNLTKLIQSYYEKKCLLLHIVCLYSSNPKPQYSRPLIYDQVSQNKNLDDIIIMATVIFHKNEKETPQQ